MIVGIKVEPIVGCIAAGDTEPFLEQGRPVYKRAFGTVVDIKDGRRGRKLLKIKNVDYYFPLYRIEHFTFGGVMVPNPYYDRRRVVLDNDKIMRKLLAKK